MYSEEANAQAKQFDNELRFIFRKPVLRSKTTQRINKFFFLSQSSSLKQRIPLEIGFEEFSSPCSKRIFLKNREQVLVIY